VEVDTAHVATVTMMMIAEADHADKARADGLEIPKDTPKQHVEAGEIGINF
jgi:hypothetical protein